MATHSSILVWEIPCTEEPVGCSPKGRKDSDTTIPIGMLYISMTEKALCSVFSLQMYQTLVVPYFYLPDRSSK